MRPRRRIGEPELRGRELRAAVAHDGDASARTAAPEHRVEIADGPRDQRAIDASSPLKSCGAKGVVSSRIARGPRADRMPAPSSSTIVRSMPGKRENGPSRSTSAMLTRHRKVSSAAPGGYAAISVVRPPPFFHGIER